MNIPAHTINTREKPHQLLLVRQIRLPFPRLLLSLPVQHLIRRLLLPLPLRLRLRLLLSSPRPRFTFFPFNPTFLPLHLLLLRRRFRRLFLPLPRQEHERILAVAVAPNQQISEPPQLREPRRVALPAHLRRRGRSFLR
uniref:Uncharacterized protein n=1 Tax=Opuntia streptacantha TaxID=393608 RepID=A0A7C9CDA7_OPUST